MNLFGGARAARQRRRELANRERENNAWFDQRYNELSTEGAEAQAALTAMRAAQQQRMASARGASSVMGASAGSVAAEKNAANMAMGQTIGQLAAQGQARKDAIEKSYLAEKNSISDARLKGYEQDAQNVANAATQLSKLGAGMNGKDVFGKKT
jgi:hypothetical protein